MELDELFRLKLENSELIPGDGVRISLMRKTGRKEFLRFNPSRFNIWYLGGIAAVALTAVILLGTARQGKNREETKPAQPEMESVVKSIQVQSQNQVAGGEVKSSTAPAVKKDFKKDAGNYESSHVEKGLAEKPVGANTTDVVRGKRAETPEKSGIIMEKLTGGNITGFQLQKKTLASFDASVSAGCFPLKVQFTNRSAAWDSCRWIFGDGGYSTKADPEWIFDNPGEYKVSLKVFGPGGSESSTTLTVNVYPHPKARFEIDPQKPILPDDQIRFINYSTDAVKYRWEFGDGKTSESPEPEHKYSRYSSYNVRFIVWSEHGCADSLVLKDAFAVSGCFINFPNAFIPNVDGPSGGNYSTKSDEVAQIFHPVTSGVSEFQMRIFSRSGILIFESNDINTGWDGYHKGQLCETGVYIWKVRGAYKNGETFVKMGDVTLLKK